MNKVFIDTAAWLALVNKNDEFHKKAKEVRENLLKEKVNFVTTNQIIIEVANTLSKSRFKKAVVKLTESIKKSKNINVIFIDEEIYTQAWERYKNRDDKEWSFTDCISFIIMEDEEIQRAFTTDHHFEQAGFTKLL